MVTLQQVADHAGVSLATASRALHGSNRTVRPELRDRVLASARTLQYSSHGPAQALARSTTSLVGLIVHDVTDPYFSAIAAGAMRVAREYDLLVMLADTVREPALELDYLSRLRAQRARAVLLAGSGHADPAFTARLTDSLAAFAETGGRIAAISHPELTTVDRVQPDNRGGAALVAGHFADLGHRSIGVVTGPAGLTTVQDRLDGFRAELDRLDLPEPAVVAGDFTRDGAYAAVPELLAGRPDVTAIFALTDLMAAGTLARLRELNRTDIAVAGFSDIPLAADLGLTTVHLPLPDLGGEAMRLVLSDRPLRPRTIHLPATLIPRTSSHPAPK
jgi:LacI family transcriptional regulator